MGKISSPQLKSVGDIEYLGNFFEIIDGKRD